jgi:glycosyltransferase involved in cell wall biosynthesis
MQGGAELAVKEIADRIRDYEFYLICARLRRDLPKREKIGNVNVYRVGFGNNFDKILLPFLGFLKARNIYNLSKIQNLTSKIYIWGIMASWGSLAALVFKIFYPRIPFLLTLQEGDAPEYIEKGRGGLINLSWRLLLKKADYVQVISNYLADMARNYGYKGEIEVVPNGVDLGKFQIPKLKTQINFKSQISNLRKELKIEENEQIIITVSRLVRKNGIGDLIDAVSQLSIINYQLLIIGSGPLEKQLKLQVEKLNLGKKIFFLGDVPNKKIFEYLAISDIFCRPSLSEGLGTAFLEAMAAGVPVVATPVGGIPDFLKSGETGLFCEIKNPQSIAEKIKILLENNELREKIIKNARELVEKKYNWDAIGLKMKNIFNKLTK